MTDGALGFDEVLATYFAAARHPGRATASRSDTSTTSGPCRWACAPGSTPMPGELELLEAAVG